MDRERFQIGVACGGTGGHVMPGLATAQVLSERGHRVTLWMTGKEIEDKSVSSWKGDIIRVPAEGFPTRLSLKGLRSAWKIWQASNTCAKYMRADRPDILLAMGSYASAGPALAARRLRVPYILHEANVLPGRAVRFLAKWAAVVACQFEEIRFYMSHDDIQCTGMPLRKDLTSAPPGTVEGLPGRDNFTILVMGGSAGAHALNETVTEALAAVGQKGHRVQVIHLSGPQDEEWVRDRYHEAGIPSVVKSFVSRMAPLYQAADLAICRAGASTCAEVCLFGVPSLMVPYPFAAGDHQTANARALEKAGGVDVVPEHDLSALWLVDYIEEALRNPKRLARMSAALKIRTPADAALRLAELIEQHAHESRKGSKAS